MEIKTFADFINNYNIEIPIIQRDYVYGRKKSQPVGKKLVEDMISYIENKKNLDLNFIYGIENNSKDEKKFYFPIDGQQRLTTLYLLYWYVSIRSGHKEDFLKLNPDFSYKTRSSAKDFFLWISDRNNDILFDFVQNSNLKFDDGIRDMSGFKAAWNYDNTVQSCIYILNQIHEKLKGNDKIEEIYLNLNDPEKCYLKFTVINENNFFDIAMVQNKSELDSIDAVKAKANKTYIRMNARGKQLTSFEKIKAIVDSLDQKDKTDKFAYKYDTKYIGGIYSYVKSEIPAIEDFSRIKEITNQIDKMSYVFFVNLFGIWCVSEKDDFRNCIYERESDAYIRELKYLKKGETTQKYIDFMNYYMNYLDENTEYNSTVFKYLGMNNKFSEIYAEVLYVYYAKKNKIDLSKQDVEVLHLVLKNLRYADWGSRKYQNVKKFIQDISCYESLIQYFCEVDKIKDYIVECGLDDIKVRWKEQVILAKCCANYIGDTSRISNFTQKDLNVSDYRYYESYRQYHPKLQFVMQVAGIWNKTLFVKSDFDIFIKYLEKYEIYRKDDLLWRQDYAVATYTKEQQSEIVIEDIDAINSISMGNSHIWNAEWYGWNDKDEEAKSYQEKLRIAEHTYSLEECKLSELKIDLMKKNNEECPATWLGNALFWSEKLRKYGKKEVCMELFKCKLTNESNLLGSVNIFNGYENEKKPFMMHIFKISRLKDNREVLYGIKNWTEKIRNEQPYEVDLRESCYDDYVGNRKWYTFRKCKIGIYVNEIVHEDRFEELPSNKELCMYCVERENIYSIYEYQADFPYKFKKYEYDMTKYLEDCKISKKKWESFKLTIDDLLTLYKECGGWGSDVINKEKINKEHSEPLWREHKFEKKSSSYTHNIVYDYSIQRINKGNNIEIL